MVDFVVISYGSSKLNVVVKDSVAVDVEDAVGVELAVEVEAAIAVLLEALLSETFIFPQF